MPHSRKAKARATPLSAERSKNTSLITATMASTAPTLVKRPRGESMNLEELTADAPLVFHIFSPDCPHCQRHMPYVKNLYGKLDGKAVNFLMYSVDSSQRGSLACTTE